MRQPVTTIQITKDDKAKIDLLRVQLSEKYGYKVSLRVAMMIAVNSMLEK